MVRHRDRLAGALCLLALNGGVSSVSAEAMNVWPDPQYAVQDQIAFFTAMNDELTETIPPIAVTSNTTGANAVTFYTANTEELEVGDLVNTQAPADPALRATWLWVTGLVHADAYGDFFLGGASEVQMNRLGNAGAAWKHLTLDCGRFLINAGPGI